jgi:hypothetical protein
MNRPILLALAFTLATLGACAPAVEPVRVRAADLAGTHVIDDLRVRPVVIEFDEGDAVPIDLSFTGDLLELTPASPVLGFRARRRFFVRLSRDGLALSLDGVHFGVRPKEPGTFSLGVSASPEGARVHVDIKTPAHAPEGG